MTDRPTLTRDLDHAHARILEFASMLNAQARDDLAGAVAPSVALEGTVSGSSPSSSTETGMDALRTARDYQTILGKFRHVANLLEHLWEELHPHPTGQTCPTSAVDRDGQLVRCAGEVTHQGRCWECHDFIKRAGRNPEASLLADWNARRPKPCGCNQVCCPDGCQDMVPPSSARSVSERCHKRMVRKRAEERAATGTGGTFAWRDPS